jgi:hypothetical protein
MGRRALSGQASLVRCPQKFYYRCASGYRFLLYLSSLYKFSYPTTQDFLFSVIANGSSSRSFPVFSESELVDPTVYGVDFDALYFKYVNFTHAHKTS